MNNSKNTFSPFLFFENIKKSIEIFFKTCSRNNRVYTEASTQTTDVFCNSSKQNLMDSTKILSPQQSFDQGIDNNLKEEIKTMPDTNRPSNKFVEDPQFSRILKSYSQLNSSSYLPLNLNNGLLFQPIYAEGQSPAELELESFKATLKCYRNILSFQANPIYKGFQWSSKVDFFSSSNSESLFRPIKSEVKFSSTFGEPSTSLSKPNLLVHRITRIIAL